MRLQQKKGIDYFTIIMIIFTLFLGITLALMVDYDELTMLDKIMTAFPGIFIVVVALCLWCFFRKQVVDIKILENGLLFIKKNGKKVKVINDSIEVKDIQSTYVFYLSGERVMTAYKYMPFDQFKHKEKIDNIVNELTSKGYLSYKKGKCY